MHKYTQNVEAYVVDHKNHVIRQITADGGVSTLCGTPGKPGAKDGKGSGASFSSPRGIVIAPDGTLYVADSDNHTIRKVTPNGIVTTLCGCPGKKGSADGKGSKATFCYPVGITMSPHGYLYVSDSCNHTIRRITLDGSVTTLCGSPGKKGCKDGKGGNASFQYPEGIACSSDGTLFITDSWNHTIRKVTLDGTVTTLCGSPEKFGSADGRGTAAQFRQPSGISIASDGTLLVADTFNHCIRRVSQDGTVTTLCGTPGRKGSSDDKDAVTFNNPTGIATLSNGALLVADNNNHTIRKIANDGTVSTLCGAIGRAGFADGWRDEGVFNFPISIAAVNKSPMSVVTNEAPKVIPIPMMQEPQPDRRDRDGIEKILHALIDQLAADRKNAERSLEETRNSLIQTTSALSDTTKELLETKRNFVELQEKYLMLQLEAERRRLNDIRNSGGHEVNDLEQLMKSLDLEQYYDVLEGEEVTLESLLTLNESHLKELDFPLGPRQKLLSYIQQVNKNRAMMETPQPMVTSPTQSTIPNDNVMFSMRELPRDSPEFQQVDTLFKEHIEEPDESEEGEDYEPGLQLQLCRVIQITNPELESKFQQRLEVLKSLGRTQAELRQRYAFHGSEYLKLLGICHNGLLKVGNPLNPSPPIDPHGRFGNPRDGVRVSICAHYALKYSNGMKPLVADDKVWILMLKVLPAKCLHVTTSKHDMKPTPGYDSHSDSEWKEWYLFNEDQSCPCYLLEVQTVEE